MRLDKFLSNSGQGSRSIVKKLIKSGRISVNGETVKSGDIQIDTSVDHILMDNTEIIYEEFEYYLLNKPAGYVSARNDNTAQTVISLIESEKKDLSPAGRLDKDTEGLLIITNDGELLHNLIHPSKHVNKTYYAELSGIVAPSDIEEFKKGLYIGDEDLDTCLPAELTILSTDEENDKSCVTVTICEGKFHQVKRMFAKVGKTVTYLKRLSYGNLTLPDDLELGEYIKVSKDYIVEKI